MFAATIGNDKSGLTPQTDAYDAGATVPAPKLGEVTMIGSDDFHTAMDSDNTTSDASAASMRLYFIISS